MRLLYLLVLFLAAGCTEDPDTAGPDPGHTNIVTPAPEPAEPPNTTNTIVFNNKMSSIPPSPMLLAASGGGNNKATISVVWSAVSWGRPVSYVLGVGTAPGVYSVAGTTSGTSYQYTGLQWQTLYYLAVKTMDSSGLQSPWSQWYHYQTGKPNHPAPQPPMPTTQ